MSNLRTQEELQEAASERTHEVVATVAADVKPGDQVGMKKVHSCRTLKVNKEIVFEGGDSWRMPLGDTVFVTRPVVTPDARQAMDEIMAKRSIARATSGDSKAIMDKIAADPRHQLAWKADELVDQLRREELAATLEKIIEHGEFASWLDVKKALADHVMEEVLRFRGQCSSSPMHNLVDEFNHKTDLEVLRTLTRGW